MRAGPLRHRCTLQKPVLVKNKSGGFDTSWLEVGKLWAEITLPTGRVSPTAEQIQAVVSVEIRLRPRADAVAGCRLVHSSGTFKIEASLIDYTQSMLRLLCSNVNNP